MEKPKQTLDEWLDKAEALLAEIDAQNGVLTPEKIGQVAIELEAGEPIAA